MEGVFWALSGGVKLSGRQVAARDDLASRVEPRECNAQPNARRSGKKGLRVPPELDLFGHQRHTEDSPPQDSTPQRADAVDSQLRKLKLPRKKQPKPSLSHRESARLDEDAMRVRKQNAIKVEKAVDLGPPMLAFADYLPSGLVVALEAMGLQKPTPIQMQTIPAILDGHEVLGVAPTGSGKTLSFLLPALSKIYRDVATTFIGPRVMVIAPTIELADQIGRVAAQLVEHIARENCKSIKLKVLTSKAAVTGLGQAKIDIVVGTPMRVLSCLESDPPTMDVSQLKDLILDEADKLFESEFLEQIDSVLFKVSNVGNKKRKCCRHLFSATLPPAVESAARTVLEKPVKITVGGGNYGGGTAAVDQMAGNIEQSFLFAGGCGEQGKMMALRNLIKEGLEPPVLIFVESKERVIELLREVNGSGMTVDALHSDRSQEQRQRAIEQFRSGSVWMLICTDVLARGLDFKGVSTVVNFDFPTSAVSYVHRIGRTGRAGNHGRAITIFTEEDKPFLKTVANVAAASGAEVPGWMLLVNGADRRKRKQMEKQGHKKRRKDKAEPIGGPMETKYDKRQRLRRADMRRNSKRASESTGARRSGLDAK